MKGMVDLSLQFVFGRAGSGKSTYCLNEIRAELCAKPIGPPLIMLVPEQATHQMEVALAKTPELGGIMRAQILSFRRLSWRVLAETGGGNQVRVGDNGKRMLLRRLLLQQKPNLKVLARSAARPGMADSLARVIAELKSYRISPQDLSCLKAEDQRALKFQDLALLYREYEQELQGRALDSHDELSLLALKLPLAESLKEAKVWVDGFKGFTPQELEALRSLVGLCRDVVITLPIDPEIIKRADCADPGVFKTGEEFFADSWKTYQLLLDLARDLAVLKHPDVYLTETRRFQNGWIRHLEENVFHYPIKQFTQAASDSQTNKLRIIAALNKRIEVEGVAKEMLRLARDEGLRWQQMALVSGNLGEYHELIERVLTLYEIPFFMDHKRKIIQHPLIELLLSSVELAASAWGYEALFRCLKTGFFPLSNDEVDLLENYCLQYGIKEMSWRLEKDWNHTRSWNLGSEETETSKYLVWRQAQVNCSRQKVRSLLLPFIDAVLPDGNGNLKCVRTITEAMFTLLEALNIPDQLAAWANKARQGGQLSEALVQEQIWDAIVDLFDELVVGLGDESLELADFLLILTSGLENLELGLIPPGLDQVLVGTLERSRNPEVEVMFLVGANEGVFPRRPENDGLLSNSEREYLAAAGLNLAPRGLAMILEEQFFIYMALTRARQGLYVGYPLTDDEGKGLTVSTVVTHLIDLFPSVQTEFWGNSAEGLTALGHPESLMPHYAVYLCGLKDGEEPSQFWRAVEAWLSRHSTYGPRLSFMQTGLNRVNQEKPLERALTKKLYGKNLLASVSRLEKFARCPFAHYASYGLKLRERPVQQLSNPDMGEYFHALLRDFALHVQDNGLDWGKLTKEESWQLLNELSERLTPQIQNEILLSTARYRYLTHRLKRTVHHAVRVLGEHVRRGQFLPVRMEVDFGPHAELPGKVVPLSDGGELILRGQIDRVDAAVLEGTVYFRIIDYKSRELLMTLDGIYHGLNLQLLAYLDVVLNGAEMIVNARSSLADGEELSFAPAGFLYFPVIEPMLDEKIPLRESELDNNRMSAVKIHGYLLANSSVLSAMDEKLASEGSNLLGIRLNADGTFRKGSNVISEEQFGLLRKHLDSWLQQAGNRIRAGEITIAPYRNGKADGCQYCCYRPVCHFDSALPENSPRILEKMSPDQVWKKLETKHSGQANLPSPDSNNHDVETNLSLDSTPGQGGSWHD